MKKAPCLTATVVITTKDRCHDLRNALTSCFSQTIPVEVLVIDDASTDGTEELVQQEFPQVKLIKHKQPMGYIIGRNEAARLASGDIIFSIDDDAIFTTPHIVEQVLVEFNDMRIGAVAIPYVDINKSPEIKQLAPIDNDSYCTDRFIGTAHALRKDLFLKLKGYRECYFHQGEERDYCLRMLDSGFVVKLGKSDLIHHYESPKRDTKRMDLYGRRNDILFAWFNLPWRELPAQITGTTLKGIWFGFQVKRPIRMIHGLWMGYISLFKYRRLRQPVKQSTVKLFWKLQKSAPMNFLEVTEALANRKVVSPRQEN